MKKNIEKYVKNYAIYQRIKTHLLETIDLSMIEISW